MIIEFERAFSPEDMGPGECGLCGLGMEIESVVARVLSDGRGELGGACCRGCITYFGQRNPEKHPTHGEFEELLERYPEPIWPSRAAANEAELMFGLDGFLDALEEFNSWIALR